MAIQEKDPRFKNLELKVGIMAVAALAGIIAIIIFVGVEKDLFINKYRVYFTSESGSGFVQGMPVKLSGFKIGRVKKIELTEDARVKVIAEINKKYERWLREGSRARLSKEGFIGESVIEFTIGNPKGRVIQEGDMIPYEKTGGIDELVSQAKPVLNEVKEIIHYANDPHGDLKVTIGNLRELTAELKETGRGLNAAVRDADGVIRKAGAIVSNINDKGSPLMDSAAKTMKNLEGFSSRIDPLMYKMENITDRAESALGRLPSAAEKIEKAASNAADLTEALSKETPRIKTILKDAQETLKDSREIVRGVRQSWPVRLMIPPARKPELVPLDGFVIKKDGR